MSVIIKSGSSVNLADVLADKSIPVTVVALPSGVDVTDKAARLLGHVTLDNVSVAVTGTFFQATQAISAVALPLPSGAATAALQTTGNVSLASIDTKTPALIASRVPVDGSGVIQPISGAVSVSNFPATQPVSIATAVAVTGTFFQATQPMSAVALPLPAGASTVAKQPALGVAGTPSADVLTIQGAASMTPLKIDGSGVTQPISGSVSVSNFPATQPISAAALPLPAGASTAAKQPAISVAGTPSVDVLTIQGAATMTPLKVDGSAVTQPVSGTFFQATQPVSIAAAVAVTGTFFQATQPISAAALPLPTGAATSANQTTELASLASIVTNTGNVPVPTAKGVQGASAQPVQDLKDAGRSQRIISLDSFPIAATAETLMTLSFSVDNAAPSTGTSYNVTAGKRFRIQAILATLHTIAGNTTAVEVILRVRAAAGGAAVLASPMQLVTTIPGTAAANGAVAPVLLAIPDGWEFVAGSGVGVTLTCPGFVATTAAPKVDLTIIGYEY